MKEIMYFCSAEIESDTLLQRKNKILNTLIAGMTAKPTIYIIPYNHLILNDLGGGGICRGIASSATYSIIHRVFSRCQTMAQAEGSVCFLVTLQEN